MSERKIKKENVVVGPEGTPLTLADLPKPDTVRWVIRRKAEVVAAVRGGLLTLDAACERYGLSNEEFLGWQRSIESHGIAGLRSTRIQAYR
ncbi:MAG: DUF1153 domain-containing protein [Maricaulaceae bacterium]